MNYGLAYAIGFHPWEDAATHGPFVEKIADVFAREENGGGRHLDGLWISERAAASGPSSWPSAAGR